MGKVQVLGVSRTRGSFLWMCLLWYQQTIASNKAVPLTCNPAVTVPAGDDVTLNCTFHFDNLDKDCEGIEYHWRTTAGGVICSSSTGTGECQWNKLTYVSLTVHNVREPQNFTVDITTNCGMSQASVSVSVQRVRAPFPGRDEPTEARTIPTNPSTLAIILGIVLGVPATAGLGVILKKKFSNCGSGAQTQRRTRGYI